MEALRELCCCTADETTRIGSIQTILGKDIVRYGNAVSQMLSPEAVEGSLALYGCFATRKLLEAGYVAILSRLDPVRLLILREFQMTGRYLLGERHAASIDWKADVVSAKKADWADGVGPDKFIRSLLGGHMAEIVWVPAIRALAEIPDTGPVAQSEWVEALVAEYVDRRREAPMPVANAAELATLASFRTVAQQCFSTLSKGVHLEFVVEQDALFDDNSILEAMRKAVKALTQVAFTSHLTDSVFTSLPAAHALGLVSVIETEIK